MAALNRTAGDKGFTLIEMLVASTLIAIFVLPLVGLVSSQLRRDQRLEDRKAALRACREAMERVLDPGYPAYAVKDDTVRMDLDGRTWLVAVDAADGTGEGEPPGGTDPLEVRITVFIPGQEGELARLKALKP